MTVIRTPLIACALLLLGACAAGPGTRPADSIEVIDSNDTYRLTVPVSRLALTLPKGNLVRKVQSVGGGTGSPRYFYFENSRETSLIVSGWFEPDTLFKGARKLWDEETQRWKAGGAMPEPVNVAFEKLGGWDVVLYDHNIGSAVSSHARAHWVQAGTWIDIHISTTTRKSSAENRKTLKALLGAILVAEKGGG